MIGRLPDSIPVDGKEYPLRADYRNVLDVFTVFNDSELTIAEKWFVATYMMLEDFNGYDDLENAVCNGFNLEEAVKGLAWFFSAGKAKEDKESHTPPVFDWEQDEQMIFASVNHVANMEVRSVEFLHWWTFLAYFNEISDGMFSYIIGIRRKKQKGKQLDKSEQQFYRENADIVDLKVRHTLEEEQFFEGISELL